MKFLPLKIFFFFLIVSITSSCKKESVNTGNVTNSGNFEKTYGGVQDDYANSGLIKNESLFIFGTTKSLGEINGDHYLIKLDLKGNVLFEKTYGGVAEEEGVKILSTSDGNFILIGTTTSTGAGLKDIHVIKINSQGNIIWEKTYGGALDDKPNDIIETSNAEFCITGISESFGGGGRDIYLIWIDNNGNLIRQNIYGEADTDGGTELIEIENQEIMIFGFTRNYGAVSRDFYMLKLNSVGDSLWSQRYGGVDYEESQAFSRTSEGGFLLNGHSSSTDPNHNMFAVKLDINGNIIWDKNFGGLAHDGGEALLINSTGNYIFIGRTMSFGAGKRDVYMVTTNSHGNIISQKQFGGGENDQANEIIEHGAFYYLIGQSNSFNNNGNDDIYIIKHQK